MLWLTSTPAAYTMPVVSALLRAVFVRVHFHLPVNKPVGPQTARPAFKRYIPGVITMYLLGLSAVDLTWLKLCPMESSDIWT